MDKEKKDAQKVIQRELKLDTQKVVIGGALIAALYIIQPVKDMFYTREEGRSIEHRIEKMESFSHANSTRIEDLKQYIHTIRIELSREMDENTDRILKQINQNNGTVYNVLEKKDQSLENRIQKVEEALFKIKRDD